MSENKWNPRTKVYHYENRIYKIVPYLNKFEIHIIYWWKLFWIFPVRKFTFKVFNVGLNLENYPCNKIFVFDSVKDARNFIIINHRKITENGKLTN